MGDALVRLLAEADLGDIEFDHIKAPGPVRDIEL